MKKVYVFNPENDMALASGRARYTPPARVRQMREELHWFPSWWAEEGSLVWDGHSPLSLEAGDEIVPWGWSPALVDQLRRAGVADSFLPTASQLEQLRRLSSRHTAVHALEAWKKTGLEGMPLAGTAYICTTKDELAQAQEACENPVYKQPWSSSGKGVVLYPDAHTPAWIGRTLSLQGSVIVEERLTKLADFALEFWLDGQGGVEYRGLSLFYTDEKGAYKGNWVASEIQKFQWLTQYIPPQVLVQVRRWWEDYLRQFAYKGPVGIDMMLCREGLCPCVEINWRMTMGMVANLLHAQGKYGRLVLEYVYGHFSVEVEAFG